MSYSIVAIAATLLFCAFSTAAADTLNGKVSKTDVVDDPAPATSVGTEQIPKSSLKSTTTAAAPAAGRAIEVNIDAARVKSVIQLSRQSATLGSKQSKQTSDGRSALGIWWTTVNDEARVVSVDKSCDLKDKIRPGDRIISLNGQSPGIVFADNVGNVGQIVDVTFEHEGLISNYPCERKPLSSISGIEN